MDGPLIRVRRPVRRGIGLLLAVALFATACTPDPDGPTAAPDQSTTAAPADQQTSVGQDDAPEESATTEAGSEPAEVRDFAAPEVDDTPIEVASDIRVGVLDNGLTYYVQSNDSPGSSVSMRLAVDAGAIDENPVGTGAAHFLEHMMFNGTEKYPGNTLDAALRAIGAEIGPDFNAYTNATETVYQIEVADSANNVSTAFDVLAQWASAALITEEEVAAETPVIREEIRIRDETGDGLIGLAFENAYYAATPYEGIDVSGDAASVEALTAADLRAFYDTWYRPDNMAVIAVGDRSLDDLEDEIIEKFAGLEARGEIVEAPETSNFALRQDPYIETVIEPSFGDSYVSIDIPVRSWDSGTVGGRELELIENALGRMINNRLSEGVASGRIDLKRAGGGHFTWNRDLAFLGFNVDADDLVSGTEALMTELRASVQNPFTEAELARAVSALTARADQQLAQFGSVQDGDLANGLVAHFLSGADLSSVDDSHQMTIETLEGLDIDRVNEHYGWMMTGAAPIILVVGPDAERVGTVAEHLEALELASVAELDAFDDSIEEIEELLAEPEPIEEDRQRNLEVSNGFELEFDNGMRVLFQHSAISEGQVLLVSESPGGRIELSNADGAVAASAVAAVSTSGLGPWEPIQMRRYLADRDVSLTPYVADFSEGFSGSAATSDLETLFEMLHLSVIEPRVDEVPFAQELERARDRVERGLLDSATAASIALSDARTGGGALVAAPTNAQLDSLTEADAQRIYQDRFSSLDEHVIVIVGDVDEDVVIDLARTYIATLPDPRTDDPELPALPDSVGARLEAGSGTASGSYRLLYVADFDNDDIETRVLAEVAERILDDRLFTVIREELGASYGGRAAIDFSDPGGHFELLVSVDGDPGRIDEIADTITDEIEILRSGGLTNNDFNEAIAILDAEFGFINNAFIIESLFDEASGEEIINRRDQRRALDSISADDVMEFLSSTIGSASVIDIRNTPS